MGGRAQHIQAVDFMGLQEVTQIVCWWAVKESNLQPTD